MHKVVGHASLVRLVKATVSEMNALVVLRCVGRVAFQFIGRIDDD